ncbi:cellulase family glycosylhydrolase [Williamsia sp. SKLECPSW1]
MTRRRKTDIAAALLCLLVSAVSACAPVRADAPRVLGVASIATLTDRTSQGYDTENDAIRRVGATWIRIVMNWNEIEPVRDVYDWGRIDGAVTSARSHGLSVLALLSGPAPAWENFLGANQAAAPPADPARFGDFARAAAQRYAGSVSHWEVWNEPNLPQFWSNPSPDGYVATLTAAHRAITSVQPDATVVTGGLSTAPGGIGAVDFIRGIYAAGGGAALTAVGLHPYSYPHPLRGSRASRTITDLRAFLTRTGHADTTIWISEWGQPTGSGATAVTDDRQASILVDGLRFLRSQPGIGPVFLYTSKDWSPNPAEAELNFGLYRFDWTPKPVVQRLRSMS